MPDAKFRSVADAHMDRSRPLEAAAWAAQGLDGVSAVALIGSGGATDRDSYARAAGRPAGQVARAA